MDPVLMMAGATGLTLGAASLWLALRAQDLRAQLRANEEDLAMMARELRGREVTANGLREQTRSLSASLSDFARERGQERDARERSEERVRALEGQREQLATRLAQAERSADQLSEVQRKLSDEETAHKRTRSERDARAVQLRELAAQVRQARAEQRRYAEALEALAPGTQSAQGAPLSPSQRASSVAALTDLLLDGPARAAVLADERGLPLLAAGDRDMAKRAAALVALLPDISARATSALGGAPAALRVSTPRQSTQVLHIGERLGLAVHGDAEVSSLALRRAALRLRGVPESTTAPRRLERLPWDRPAEHALEALLRDWLERWDARAVAVLGADLLWSTGTASDEAEAFERALAGLNPVLRRFQRDGWDATALELQLTHDSGASLTLRATRSGGELYYLLISAPHPIPENAGEELVGVVRWHASARGAKAAG